MAKVSLNRFSIYKYRYWIGYALLAILLVITMVVAATLVPGGFDAEEQGAAIKSASLNLDSPSSLLVMDLPYHSLQKISITLLGLSSFSIKLPSIILAVLSIVGLLFICRRWFSSNIGVVAAVVASTLTSFIYVAQHGTPDIMHIFWPILAISTAMLIPKKGVVGWASAATFGASLGLSLMTPVGYLPILAIAIGGLLHPHVRHIIRKRVDLQKRILIIASFIAGLVPLLWMLITRPDTGLALIFKDSFNGSLLESGKDTLLRMFDFSGGYSSTAETIVPVFTLATLSICIIGGYALYRKRHTAHSYVLLAWLILLVPATLFAIENITYFLLVPFSLLFAAGVQYILHLWYKLFPQNPYARVFGLIPIAVLIVGIVASGSARYIYSYTYHPVLANAVTHDLRKVTTAIADESNNSTDIIIATSDKDHEFYQLYVDANNVDATVQVMPEPDALVNNTVIALRNSPYVAETEIQPTRIVASGSLHERSDRIYIYKKLSD